MTTARRDRVLLVALAATFAAITDQMSKLMAVSWLGPDRRDVVGSVHLHLVANYGAALGVPAPRFVFVAAVVGLGIATLSWAIRDTASTSTTVGAGLVLGGGVGNLVDRFIDRERFPPRAVVDWIDIGEFPTFNLADVAIVIGLAMWAMRTASGTRPASGGERSHCDSGRAEQANLVG